MITLIQKGKYQLVADKDKTKKLFLGSKCYRWSYEKGVGEILLSCPVEGHKPECILSEGTFKLCKIDEEPRYVNLDHLELSTGKNIVHRFLLLEGLPASLEKKSRIVPTDEEVTVTA